MAAPRYAPFVNVFVPFALLITGGNLLAELSSNLVLGRVRYTILVSAVMVLPALWLYARYDPVTSPPLVFRYWQLCWAFGFLAYALHAYFSVGEWFGWDFAQIEERQTRLVAWSNYFLLFVWGVDVAVALLGYGLRSRVFRSLRLLAHLLFVASFVVAAIVFRNDLRSTASYLLGIALIAVPLVGLSIRLTTPRS